MRLSCQYLPQSTNESISSNVYVFKITRLFGHFESNIYHFVYGVINTWANRFHLPEKINNNDKCPFQSKKINAIYLREKKNMK